MNEFIESGENFTLQRNGADVIHDGVMIEPGRVYGRTKVFKNGELVHNELKPAFEDGSNQNAIFGGTGTTSPTGLKAYFAQSMSATIDRSLSSLFENGDIDISSGLSGLTGTAGIAVSSDAESFSADGRSMVTTTLTAANTYGRKWRGVLTADGPRQFAAARIGNGVQAGGDYTTLYATQQFPTQTLATNDTLTIEWEIFIA
jgi:hypothetical protein